MNQLTNSDRVTTTQEPCKALPRLVRWRALLTLYDFPPCLATIRKRRFWALWSPLNCISIWFFCSCWSLDIHSSTSSATRVPVRPPATSKLAQGASRCSAPCTMVTTLFLARRVFPIGSSPTGTGPHMIPPFPGIAVNHPHTTSMAPHRPYSLSHPVHLPRRPIGPKPVTTRPSSYIYAVTFSVPQLGYFPRRSQDRR